MRVFGIAAMALAVFMQANAAQAEKVMVSIKPVHSLVAAIMKGAGKPGVIVSGNESPHEYQLKPSTAKRLAEAKLVFWIGPKMEAFLEKPLTTIASKARAIALIETKGLVTKEFRESPIFSAKGDDDHDHDHKKGHGKHEDHDDDHKKGHSKHDDHDDDHKKGHAKHDDHDDDHKKGHGKHDDHDDDHKKGHGKHDDHDDDHKKGEGKHADHDHDHDHGGVDVHVWLDPVNAIVMVDAITHALEDLEPKNAALFHKNAEALKKRLKALNKELAKKLKPLKKGRFVVYHDAYQYFEARYGLKAVGAVTVSPEIRPGAKHLRKLKKQMAAKHVTCAFLEPGVDKRLFKILGSTGLKVAELDPAGIDLKPGIELYPTLLRNMASNFKKCVKPHSHAH